MAEEQIKIPKIDTYILGFFSIIFASAFSYYGHQLSHFFFADWFCNIKFTSNIFIESNFQDCITTKNCLSSVIAGPLFNLIFAIFFLWLYIKFPFNMLFGSLALINASSRIGESFILMVQYFIFRYKPTIHNDERLFIEFLNFPDKASALVILLFYTVFNTILVIIAIRTTVWKGIWKWIFVSLSIFGQIPLNITFVKYLPIITEFFIE